MYIKCPLIVDNNSLKHPVPFDRCSSSLAGSLNTVLSSAKWMSAALRYSGLCTNHWVFLHNEANLEWNNYRCCYYWYMHRASKLSIGNWSLSLCICGLHIVDQGTLSSHIVTGWLRWPSGQRWQCSWYRLFVSVWCRCTSSVVPPLCLRILHSAILARKAAVRVVFMEHSWVTFYCSLYLSMPKKLNSPLPLFRDFGARYLRWILCFFYQGARKPFFNHFGHIQGKVHVWLF